MFTMKIVVCGDPIDVTRYTNQRERGMAATIKGGEEGTANGEKERERR